MAEYRRNDPWQRFCCGLGVRPVRAGSIGRDTTGYGELMELPLKKARDASPPLIRGEIIASWFQADWTGPRAMGTLSI